MNNDSKKIIGYDPQTGLPIYEISQDSRPLNMSSAVNMNANQPIMQPQPMSQAVPIPTNISNPSPQLNNNINSQQFMNNTNLNTGIPRKKNNKKLLFVFSGVILTIILVFAILLLTNGSKSRTIMIYMAGSDLESKNGLATADLNSIDFRKLDSKNNKIVLIAGGSSKWHNSYIDSNETSIYELTENGFVKVKQQEKLNMGDSETLNSFLDYVYDSYKTDEYDLIFWNHGGAIMGSEFDENFDHDNLSLEELKNAFDSSKFKNKKLELIIFRTCLNGTIEMAGILSDYADYLVASEEVTVGSSNTSVLNFINMVNSKDNAVGIGKKYISSYKKQIDDIREIYQYYGEKSSIYSTYSIVDLSKVAKLERSINNFFDDINVNSSYSQIAKLRSNLYQYANDEVAYDMVDLYNLVYGLRDLSGDKAQKLLDDIEDTVIYNWATNPDSRGISIYFPYNGLSQHKEYFINLYNTFDGLKSYNNFISKFFAIQNSAPKSLSFSENKLNVSSNENGEADFEMELTDEQVEAFTRADYRVFKLKSDGYYSLVYRGKDVKLDGNILKAYMKGRHLQAYSKEDNFKYIIPLIESELTDDYITYDAYVILNYFSAKKISDWKTDSAIMKFYYDKKSNKMGISNIILNTKSAKNLPGTISLNLADYDTVSFGSTSYKIVDENGNYTTDWESNGIFEGGEFYTDDLNFELANFDDSSDYYCVFKIYDINNNSYYSKLVKMK